MLASQENKILIATGALVLLAVVSSWVVPIAFGQQAESVELSPTEEKLGVFFTDDNKGEDLIIKSDQKDYVSIDTAVVTFSITNTSANDQNVDVRFLFGGDEKVLSMEELIENEEYVVETPITQKQLSDCESITKEVVPCEKDVQTGTSTEIKVRDRWEGVALEKQPSEKEPVKQVPEKLAVESGSTFFIPAGATRIIKAVVDIPSVWGYREEFFIEAYGDQGAYGQLDPWFDIAYTYCQKWTMTAGGGSGGVATTSTGTFTLAATGTMPVLAATSSGGRIQKITGTGSSTYPVDVVITDGTDCTSGSGSLIPFYFEDYASTTGAFSVKLEYTGISSTSAKTVLMYYGNATATDVSSKTTVYGGLGEKLVWSFGGTDLVNNVFDTSGTSNHGTLSGFAATTTVSGMVGQAISLDGVNDYVYPTNVDGNPNIYGYSVWYNSTSTTGKKLIGSEINQTGELSGSFDRTLYLGTDGKMRFAVYSGGAQVIADSVATNDGQWHHVFAYHTGSVMRLMVDGVNIGSITTGNTVYNSYTRLGSYRNAFFTLGADGYAKTYADDVRWYYNNVLSNADGLTIYNNTKSSAIFWTYGSEETQGGGGGGATSTPQSEFFF